jgi:hypothetical protein
MPSHGNAINGGHDHSLEVAHRGCRVILFFLPLYFIRKQEKPKKESKSGMKQKQKQKQNQVVNIKINNSGSGGGSGGGGSGRPPPQIPLNIFNPSLVTPNYGINNRQPVNPPDLENVDMTELMNRISSQFQPPQDI